VSPGNTDQGVLVTLMANSAVKEPDRRPGELESLASLFASEMGNQRSETNKQDLDKRNRRALQKTNSIRSDFSDIYKLSFQGLSYDV